MKMIIVFAFILAVTLAVPVQNQFQDIVLVKEQQHDNIGVNGYKFNYELSNGQTVAESAELKNVAGEEKPVLVVKGSFTYIDPASNKRYAVTYTADEAGFHPEGAHLPA